ncbi:HPr-rel-A system PqqD family peptide chaperone [Thermosulfurimonas sp. F29]|uniref:HPr-rel-A system PqqD family peptide chaperone n=1 Tax=Thermosulfurimonas sp. F29 TaxID=2867247 RepID=UPI001C83CDC3|nr:HPr-rel-A system PqqD family peptide chaperone [Thermosulfurimonas sp. F29]MBX6423282.1 HPr-rel-A system PqqD family peptide chaperone [Thermosulfurimonas sp. F29]
MKLRRLAVSEEGFVFDPETGNSYTVNETGLRILRHLKEGLPPEKIVAELVKEYEVSPEEAERDLYEFVETLKGLGLWEGEHG